MKQYEEWIKQHLPKDIPADILSNTFCYRGFYISGLDVYTEGDRGPDKIQHSFHSYDDLRIWVFKEAANYIAQQLELRSRHTDELKWRYVQDHAENGKWMYIEHCHYQFNAIHDFRLAWFETYLQLVKGGLTPAQWSEEICEYTKLLNNHYPVQHWDYDKKKMQFIEISDSKYVSQGIEEPAPGTVIRKE